MKATDPNIPALEQNNTNLWPCELLSEVAAEAIFTSLIIILILCILGNSAICIIVSRHYQLHTVTNAYFVNMAVVQLLFALLTIPPYLRIASSSTPPGEWLCDFIGFSFELFAALSSLALTLLTIERFFVINNSGRKKISAKTTIKMIFSASVLALTFSILWASLKESSTRCSPTSSNFGWSLSCFPLLSAHRTETLRILNIIYTLLCFLLPMAVMVALFVKMAKTLWSGNHGIRPMGVGNTNTIRFFAEIKTTRTLFLISVLHLCCWLPICITSLYLSSQLREDHHSSFSTTKVVSICLAFASSCINPLMYALRNPRFSIIFRPNRRPRSQGHKTVHFNKTEEQRNKTIRNAIYWAHRPTSAFVYDTSRSEETQTTSSC